MRKERKGMEDTDTYIQNEGLCKRPSQTKGVKEEGKRGREKKFVLRPFIRPKRFPGA
jgi:hypothetical protein